MFANIPINRMILYILILGAIPLLVVGVFIFSEREKLDQLSNGILSVQETALSLERKQAVNMALRAGFKEADHFYIDKHIETLSFLEPEIEGLQKIINDKNYADDEAVKKRLELLTGPGNNLAFSEGVVQSSPTFKEVTETLVHPVEVNVQDLKKILAKIEGVDIGPYQAGPDRPQLIILDFKLDKKNVNEKSETFVLNMKLLKREFQ